LLNRQELVAEGNVRLTQFTGRFCVAEQLFEKTKVKVKIGGSAIYVSEYEMLDMIFIGMGGQRVNIFEQ